MCVALAIAGSAVVGAVGTGIAANQEAGAITSSTNASINAQQQAQQKQQQILSPYTNLGSGGAIQQYQNLLGIGTGSPLQALQQTPGYQFTQQQGNQATLNSASAAGLGLSGNTLQALDQYNTGLAQGTYQNAVNNAANAVNIGESAAAEVGAGAIQTGQGIGANLVNEGNTLAGINANEWAGISKTLGNATNQGIYASTLAGLNNTPNYGAGSGLQDIGGGLSETGGGYILNDPSSLYGV